MIQEDSRTWRSHYLHNILVGFLIQNFRFQILTMSTDSNIEDRAVPDAASINNQNLRIYVTIPASMILDHMLMQLGFPPAQYRHRIYDDNKTGVTVTFNTSKVTVRGSLVPTTISGIRTMDAAIAEQSASVAAVRYMESCANAVIKDLNYSRLKQLQKENKYLKDELRKARLKSARLGRGWFLSLRYMRSFAAQFHNMAILGYSVGQQVPDDDSSTSFHNINSTAQTMRERGNRLQKRLEEVKRGY